MTGTQPSHGEIWYADLSPVRGHEQDGQRPVLVVSASPALPFPVELVIPLTTRFRGFPFHVPVRPPEGGLRSPGYLLCEHLRSVSPLRLERKLGRVGDRTLDHMSLVLHRLMALRCPPAGARQVSLPLPI
jgi:mRNA interferase MazF